MSTPAVLGGVFARIADRRVLAGVGYGAFALALVVTFVPLPANPVSSTLTAVVGSPVLVGLAGVVGGGFALVQIYRLGSTTTERPPIVDRSPERAHYPADRLAGEGIDEAVDSVGGELPESAASDWWTYREKADVSKRLGTVAVDVLESEYDVTRERAARMIETGSWTDDARAAAFLGGEEAATLPLRTQFVDWLSGEAYERRVEVTVTAIARHAGIAPVEPGAESTADPGAAESRTAAGSALPVHEAEPSAADRDNWWDPSESSDDAAEDGAPDDEAQASAEEPRERLYADWRAPLSGLDTADDDPPSAEAAHEEDSPETGEPSSTATDRPTETEPNLGGADE